MTVGFLTFKIMTQNNTEAVEKALQELDSYDPVLRASVKHVFDGYTQFSYMDVITTGVANRGMELNYGFVTLVRTDNYSTAHHLICLHLDNILRYSAFWLEKDPQLLAKRIFNGEKLRDIKFDGKQKYTDSFLAKEAKKTLPWGYEEYEKLSGYIHFGQDHIKNATELIDTNQQSVGFHASKYDMLWSEDDRLEGVALMQRITKRLLEMMARWYTSKEAVDKEKHYASIPEEYMPFKAPPLIRFFYEFNGVEQGAMVFVFAQGEGNRYRINLNQSDALIIRPISDSVINSTLRWEQEARQGVRKYPLLLVKSLGEGLEKARIVEAR
jgi:hypothetical protein